MSAYRKGADPDALTDIARSIRSLRADLTRIEASTRRAVRIVEANAGGSRVGSLARDFSGRSLPSLHACGRVLDEMVRRIEDNVAAQRHTSGLGGSASGGGRGSGGGVGGGGGGGTGGRQGLNPGPTFPGRQTPWQGRDQDDSRGHEGDHFRHTAYGPIHAWENSRREGGSGLARYERWTHAGDNPASPLLNRAEGVRYAYEEHFTPGAARDEEKSGC